jgi:hypothetical protein
LRRAHRGDEQERACGDAGFHKPSLKDQVMRGV